MGHGTSYYLRGDSSFDSGNRRWVARVYLGGRWEIVFGDKQRTRKNYKNSYLTFPDINELNSSSKCSRRQHVLELSHCLIKENDVRIELLSTLIIGYIKS